MQRRRPARDYFPKHVYRGARNKYNNQLTKKYKSGTEDRKSACRQHLRNDRGDLRRGGFEVGEDFGQADSPHPPDPAGFYPAAN
jgi:hypothetical protein